MFRSCGDPPASRLNFAHCITPETACSTHYFGVLTRKVRLDDDAFSELLIAQNDVIRGEDQLMLEQIEERGAPFADLAKEVSVSSDVGAIRVRRMIQAMFGAEAMAEQSAPDFVPTAWRGRSSTGGNR